MSEREDRIRERAYEKWQKEGETHGWHDRHWAEAEAELDAEDKNRQVFVKKASSPRKKTAKAIGTKKTETSVASADVVNEDVKSTTAPTAAGVAAKKPRAASTKKTVAKKPLKSV